MDTPKFYDNDWMIHKRGIEDVFGFRHNFDGYGAEGEAKAWFLGYLHGLNEEKKFNPFNKSWETTQREAYERGFFHAFKRRYPDHEEWRQKILKMEEKEND